MQLITDFESMIGKTVKLANFISCGEKIAILFDDGSGIIFKVNAGYEGETSVDCEEKPEPYELRDAGIISEEEYTVRRQEEHLAAMLKLEQREREQLTKLLNKYKY